MKNWADSVIQSSSFELYLIFCDFYMQHAGMQHQYQFEYFFIHIIFATGTLCGIENNASLLQITVHYFFSLLFELYQLFDREKCVFK